MLPSSLEEIIENKIIVNHRNARKNIKKVYEELRKSKIPLSITDLSKSTGISWQTVKNAVLELCAVRLVKPLKIGGTRIFYATKDDGSVKRVIDEILVS